MRKKLFKNLLKKNINQILEKVSKSIFKEIKKDFLNFYKVSKLGFRCLINFNFDLFDKEYLFVVKILENKGCKILYCYLRLHGAEKNKRVAIPRVGKGYILKPILKPLFDRFVEKKIEEFKETCEREYIYLSYYLEVEQNGLIHLLIFHIKRGCIFFSLLYAIYLVNLYFTLTIQQLSLVGFFLSVIGGIVLMIICKISNFCDIPAKPTGPSYRAYRNHLEKIRKERKEKKEKKKNNK